MKHRKRDYSVWRVARLRSARLTRRFCGNRRGSAAVEFAMIAPIFLTILFAIIETALFFLASEVMEAATQKTARLILTGQAQSAALTQATFKSALCANIPALFDCAGIVVDVRTAATFGAANTASMLNASGAIDAAGATYSPGASGDIVVVRVAYEWPIFFKTQGYSMADMVSGNRLIQSSTAFRNE